MQIRVGACAALVLSLAACGNPAPAPQGDKTPASDTAAATPSPAAETPDACTLVTTDELAAIFPTRSFTLDNMPPEKRNKPGGPRRNAVTSCTFISNGASIPDMMTVSVVLITAYSDKAQPSIERMQSGLSTLGLKISHKTIEGLGDGAYWYNIGGNSRSGVVLNVMRNPRYWLTISESSSGQDEPATVSRLTEVARQALARL